MPHQIIEYSTNVEAWIDIPELVAALHEAALQIDALPEKGLRTRAHATATYRIADNHPDNAFVAVTLRLGAGRPEQLRVEIGQTLFAVLQTYTAEVYAARPLALSYEVQEIDPTTRWNHNNLPEHLAARRQ